MSCSSSSGNTKATVRKQAVRCNELLRRYCSSLSIQIVIARRCLQECFKKFLISLDQSKASDITSRSKMVLGHLTSLQVKLAIIAPYILLSC